MSVSLGQDTHQISLKVKSDFLNIISFDRISRFLSLYVMTYAKIKYNVISSNSILNISWNAYEISNKKMQKFFKKIMKIKRAKTMIYLTNLTPIPDDNFSPSGESI